MRDLLNKLDFLAEYSIRKSGDTTEIDKNIDYHTSSKGISRDYTPQKLEAALQGLIKQHAGLSVNADYIKNRFYGRLAQSLRLRAFTAPDGTTVSAKLQKDGTFKEFKHGDLTSLRKQNELGWLDKKVAEKNRLKWNDKFAEIDPKDLQNKEPETKDTRGDRYLSGLDVQDGDNDQSSNSIGNDDDEWAAPLSKAEKMRAGLTDYSGDNDAEGGVQSAGDGSHSGGKQTIKWNGKNVEVPTANNYKDWIKRGQEILDKYIEMLDKDGHLPSSFKSKGTVDHGLANAAKNKTESNQSIKSLFYLLESSFREKKLLQQSWEKYKRIMLKALKNLPGEARDAFKGQTQQKDKLDTGARAYADTEDPALGGSSGFDSRTTSQGTFTGSADEVEKGADKYLEKIGSIVSKLDKNDLKNSIPKGADDVEIFLLKAKLPTKEITKYNAKYYSLVANNLNLKGFINGNKIIFADGSSEQTDPNNETHKEIAQAQLDLGALRLGDARKMFGVDDLPKDSSMSLQMQAGTKGFKRDEVEWNGKPVPALNKYNWKQWIELGQALLDRIKNPNNEPLRGNPAESIRYTLSKLFEKIEMSDQDKANWKVLQQQFAKVGKELPPEAQDAYKDLQDQKRIIQFTDDLPGKSAMFKQSQIDPSNRVSKDQKDRDGYAERIKNLLYTFSAGSPDLKNKVSKAKNDFRYIIAQLPNKEAAKYSTMFYSELASKLGLQGLVRANTIFFTDGSKEKVDRNNDTHKEIVRAQYDLDLISSKKANKLVDLFDLQDLPSPSGMSLQMKHGTKGFKNTGELKLKGTSKTLPPLTSKTVNDYVNTYLGILRKYKRGTGKGGGSIGMPLTYKQGKQTESKSYTIREHLNILLELESNAKTEITGAGSAGLAKEKEIEDKLQRSRSRISDLDKKDLEAIENAFKTAQQRKAIKPEEHTKFTQIAKYKEQLFKKLGDVPKMTKGDTPGALQKAMDIKATGDKNYGEYSDQIKAVLSNPTADNLVAQANEVLGKVGIFDTRWNAMNNFYGIIAQDLGLEGLISHVDTAVNPPQVFYSRAKETPLSKQLGDKKMPRGEFESENVDFSDPKHRNIAQAQLNKNLLPASITYQKQTVNPQEEFGITKQEPQEPQKTGDVSPTVKSGERKKPSDLDTADELQAAGQTTTDTGQTTAVSGRSDRPSADGGQAASKVGSEFGKKFGQKFNKEKMPTGPYAYDRYVPLPKSLNRLFRGDRKTQYYVDRIPLPGRGLMSNQLQITSDNKGTGFETVHDTKFNRARDAIMKFLKDNNTSLIDQAEWAKLKKWNDMAGDGPGDGWLKNYDTDVDNREIELGKNKYGPPPKRADQSGQANIDSGGVNPALSANAEIQTGTDQDLRPSFSQSSPTGNVFSITQDNTGWWITKTEPNGQPKKFKGPYKTDKEASKLAIGFANSTNSEYKPYEAPANSAINKPVPQTNAEDEKMKLDVKAATNKAIQAMIAAGKDNAVGRQKIFNEFEKQGWLEQLEFYKDDKDMEVLYSKFEGVKAGVPQWWMTDAEMQQQIGQQNNSSANNGEQATPEVTEKINAWRQAAKARGGTGKLRMLNYGNGTVAVVGEGVPKQNGLPVPLSAKMPKKVFLEQFGKYLNKDFSQAIENKDFTRLLKNAGLLKEFY